MDKDHNLRENLLALILGSALVSLGVIFFNQVGLLTGGTAGLATVSYTHLTLPTSV